MSMKKKISKILGVALVVVLLASLTVGLSAVPAGADPGELEFSKLDLPKVEAWTDEASFADTEGDFWVTPDIDVGPIAKSPDGGVLFAAAYPDVSGWYEVLKSIDGGYAWTVTGFFDEADNVGDATAIVDIVTSPGYGDDTTVVVATQNNVYISDDSGNNFVNIPGIWAGIINDLDVTITEGGDLAIMVGTTDGDVYVKKGLLDWIAQDIPGSLPPGTDAVLACAFLPTFANDGDIGICAIVTDYGNSTTMTFSFEDTNVGGGWGTSGIANAPITNAEGDPFESEFARIAFPDDFDAFVVGNNVCFVGICEGGALESDTLPPPDGSDAYKIICKEAGLSTAIDLNVRGVIGTLLPTATAITSIDVCGPAEAATILVGTDTCNLTDTPTYWFAYHSEDSGESWMFSFKQPTGGHEVLGDLIYISARTQVLMAPDFCGGSTAYAATRDWGNPIGTSAFQRTTDGAESWNQISIIDYGNENNGYVVRDLVVRDYNETGMLCMVTWKVGGDSGAVWQRTNGRNWERIWSYANAGVTDSLCKFSMPMDGSAIFAVDIPNNRMWRSTDGGATWPKKITTKDNLTWVTTVSATTLYTCHADGSFWWSTKSGVGWTKPDYSEIPAGTYILFARVMGDVVLVSSIGGMVFISSDGGETVEKVGTTDPGDANQVTLAEFDLSFAANNIIYATIVWDVSGGGSPVPGAGVWRCEVDLVNPGASQWERIDNCQDLPPAGAYDWSTVELTCPAIALPPAGVLYVIDGAPVVPGDVAGGLWRCANPTADVDSVYPPYFEKENEGLSAGDSIGLMDLDVFPVVLFCRNNAAAHYWEQVVMYTDTSPVEWSVPMMATTATEGNNPNLEFGTRTSATDGYDSGIDVGHPPLGPGVTLDAYFSIIHPTFPELDKDYRAPADSIQWTLHAESSIEDITLTWDAGSIPAELLAYMDTGISLINMKAQDNVVLPAGEYTVIILVSTEVEIQLSLKAGWNMVSVPVTPQDTSAASVFAGTEVVYT